MLGTALGGFGFVVVCFVLYKYYERVVENKEKDERRVEYYKKQEALVRANEREREMLIAQELAIIHEKAEKRAKIALKKQQASTKQKSSSRRMRGGAYAVSPAHMDHQDLNQSESSGSVVLSSLHSSEFSYYDDESLSEYDSVVYSDCDSEHELEGAMEEEPSHTGTEESEASQSSSEREFNRLLDEQSAIEGYESESNGYSDDESD